MILTNLLYIKKQLIKKDIKKYLKKIFTLIRKDEVKRTKERTISDYKKINEKVIETT